jgi:hypothetical protein
MALDPSVTAALKSLQARRDSLDRAIAALRALDDGESANTDGASPLADEVMSRNSADVGRKQSTIGGGLGGVRKVLHAWPGRGFTAAQLAHAMQENGWITSSKNPRAAARASANRLRDDEAEHVFFEEGQFVYRPPGAELDLQHATTQGDGGP